MAAGEVLDTTSADDEVALAQSAQDKVYSALGRGKEAAWELAEALYEFDECSGWRRLGYETLEEWLAQPEVGMKKSSYYDLVSSWRKFVVHQEIEPARLKALEPSKAAIVASRVAKGQVKVDEAIGDIETLGYRDLREKYAKPKAEPKAKEPEKKPDTKAGETSVRKDEAEPEQAVIVSRALTLAQVNELHGKRFHVRPDEAKTAELLEVMGVALVPDIPWEDIERAVAGGGDNPRIPVAVLKSLLIWRG